MVIGGSSLRVIVVVSVVMVLCLSVEIPFWSLLVWGERTSETGAEHLRTARRFAVMEERGTKNGPGPTTKVARATCLLAGVPRAKSGEADGRAIRS
jgi:hypothetical protein